MSKRAEALSALFESNGLHMAYNKVKRCCYQLDHELGSK